MLGVAPLGLNADYALRFYKYFAPLGLKYPNIKSPSFELQSSPKILIRWGSFPRIFFFIYDKRAFARGIVAAPP